MKRLKHLKISLYALGFLLIVISGFMTFSTHVITIDEEPGFDSLPLIGFQSVLWFVFMVFAIVLTLIAQNMNSMAMKALFYVVLVVGSLFTVYVAFVSSFSWGGPIHPSLKSGATVGFLGLLVTVISGIIFIPLHLQKRTLNLMQTLLVFGMYLVLISCAFLPFEGRTYFAEDTVINGIDDNLFFNYWIFGLALLILGFRATLFSKIITYAIVLLSLLHYVNFCLPYSYVMKVQFLIGGYIATLAYLGIVVYAIYAVHSKPQPKAEA